MISRNGKDHYGNLSIHGDAAIIVNTTPVGMYPDTLISPVELSLFPRLEGVLDVIYNPARTALLQQAESRGIVARNGLLMLVAQAKEAAEYFLNSPIDDAKIDRIYQILSDQMQNIVLIGMPGCGKSTIGKYLAKELGRKLVDADAEIVKRIGDIPAYFASHGEEDFRQVETEVLRELGKQSGLVIATGGGCVTRPENYPALHQNGRIVWIRRDLSELPTNGRPVSQRDGVAAIYEARKPLYTRFADVIVDNKGTVGEVITEILKKL